MQVSKPINYMENGARVGMSRKALTNGIASHGVFLVLKGKVRKGGA